MILFALMEAVLINGMAPGLRGATRKGSYNRKQERRPRKFNGENNREVENAKEFEFDPGEPAWPQGFS